MYRLPRQFQEDDLLLSGPHVWPRVNAGDAPARFIHQRPELAYLAARRQGLEDAERDGREPEAADRIRCTAVWIVTRTTHKGSRKYQQTLGSFNHTRRLDDDEDDVREFLKHLDWFLRRCMVPGASPYWSVQLQFALCSQARGARLVTFQRPWL